MSWPGAPRLEKNKPNPAPLPAPCVLPGAATRRLMKREEAGQGLGQQATARGQCEAGGGRPSGRDRQSPHMGSRRSRPAPLGPGASAAAGSLSAKCRGLGSLCPRKMSPRGCGRKRRRRETLGSARAPRRTLQEDGEPGAHSTHGNHVPAFLNACEVNR